MRRTRAHSFLAVLACLVASGGGARAEDQTGVEPALAILELYVTTQEYGKTPEYVLRIADEITRLGRYSVLDRADAERLISTKMSTSSRSVTDEKLKEIEATIKKGEDLLYTKPREAIQILATAKEDLTAIMETLSLNQKILDEYFRAQMLLARSHLDNGNRQRAAEILEEIIRVFGDEKAVTTADYHPKIVELYRETYRNLSEGPKASLRVETMPEGAEVLIHGRAQASASPATFDGLYPGTVTVQTRKNGRESMVRKIELKAGETQTLSIDIDYETSLAFSDKKFGFRFPDAEVLKSRVADFGSRIGVMLNVDLVLITGLVDVDGRTHLEAYMVDVAGKKLSEKVLPISMFTKGNVVSKKRVEELAHLVSGLASPGTTIEGPWYESWLGWTGVGVGVVGVVVGAAMWAAFESTIQEVQCTQSPPACKSLNERTILAADANVQRAVAGVGFGAAAIGAAAAVVGFLLLRPEVSEEAPTTTSGMHLEGVAPWVGPNSVGAGATLRF
jgi:hypothetical protein